MYENPSHVDPSSYAPLRNGHGSAYTPATAYLELETYLGAIGNALEHEKDRLAGIRSSIERCENLPDITTSKLLNLPVRFGRLKE